MVDTHDRGSITPVLAAMISIVALASLAVAHVVDTQVTDTRAQTAADALALAALIGADLDDIAAWYDVDEYEVDHGEYMVMVRVERDGVTARASAVDHRRTLEPAE